LAIFGEKLPTFVIANSNLFTEIVFAQSQLFYFSLSTMVSQQWYYRKGTARFGPVSSADLKTMATEGKLESTDLLRGVGMTAWIPASKIKGLFPKTELETESNSTPPTTSTSSPKINVEPEKHHELGLAPLQPIEQNVVPTAKIPATKTVVKPSPKPTTQTPKINPKPKTSTIPATPQIPTAPNTTNPFAQFGLEQTTPNNPFATEMPAFGNLDALVALEKQGQTIYREPTIVAEPDPFAKNNGTQTATTKSDWIADLGPAGTILTFLMPFVFMLVLGYICGSLYALRMYVTGIKSYLVLMFFIFSMTSGLTKIAGLFAGNCLLKLKIKNEVLALGYGGLLGLFSLYVFMAGHIWMTINANPYRGMIDDQNNFELREMDEDGRSLVLRPDEPSPFANPDFVPLAATETVANTDSETDSETDEEDNEENKENQINNFGENQEQQRHWEAEQMEMQESAKRLIDFANKLNDGISIFASFLPFYVFLSFLPFGILLWPINACILVLGTAHATWTANLGYDPTRGDM
jgi:hypothetical protein